VKKGKRRLGFTLIELLTTVALLFVFLVFLAKLNFSSENASRSIKLATKILASTIDNVRSQAIADNCHVSLAIDISSPYKFRRIALCRKGSADSWISEHVIILPERTFFLPLTELSSRLNRDLSHYEYVEENLSINEKMVTCYHFIFNGMGILCNFEKNSAMIALGYGRKQGENIEISDDSPLVGVFVIPTGKQIILGSKKAMKETL
jgi:type II secretory pathway pseudopilin PulG